ncbi:MAG TPA: IS200/IS605 family transposase [Thermoanaerobaculia bacterium]|nr:IS200/IS605 family transposase [Thermoanaerobaculia bacterium]
MPHTYSSLSTHVTFSTKRRQPIITPDLEARLLPYFGGIVRQLGGTVLVSNTVPDHVHLLIELPPTITMSEAIGQLKGSSSKWIHDSFPERRTFAWQRGFGAFSVSRSNVPGVARYIESQKEHHRKVTFEEELVRLLRRHGIDFDERSWWSD